MPGLFCCASPALIPSGLRQASALDKPPLGLGSEAFDEHL